MSRPVLLKLPLFPPTNILPPPPRPGCPSTALSPCAESGPDYLGYLHTWEARRGTGDIILVFQSSKRRLEAQGGGLLPWCDETLAERAGRREAAKMGAERQAGETMTTRRFAEFPDVTRRIVAEPLAACWRQRPEEHLPSGSSQTAGKVITYRHE